VLNTIAKVFFWIFVNSQCIKDANITMIFKRILVPLDGSVTAEKVIPFVISEAKLHGASLVLLRVIAPLRRSLSTSPSILGHVYEQIDAIAEDYLERISETILAEGLEVQSLIEHGTPAQTIIDVAQQEDCDLIILGSHGETNAAQWRLGSVADKVLKARSLTSILLITTTE
jgi:nucleotide-binding universal stress UspA family protein